MPAGEVAGLPGDRAGEIEVEQKMLAERLPGIQAVPRENVAQPG
jgi:hypothetical protein